MFPERIPAMKLKNQPQIKADKTDQRFPPLDPSSDL